MTSRNITIRIEAADALSFPADVLVLKYAQALYGVDRAAVSHLVGAGIKPELPKPGTHHFVSTSGILGVRQVLFLGVDHLDEFGYTEIRDFGRRAISVLADGDEPAVRVALTVHGPGYGLDEVEAFESQLAGIVESISETDYPSSLCEVIFVEHDNARAERLSAILDRLLPEGLVAISRRELWSSMPPTARETFRTAGYASASKRRVFVAMPFADNMSDVFHYGIQGAINSVGMLAERADLATFTGDVMQWVRERIATAYLVVADLTDNNPNVYLEVGYAWGKSIPTVLLSREASALEFNVQGQRQIVYASIKDLEVKLAAELRGLSAV